MQRKQRSSFIHAQSSAASPGSTDSALCGGPALAEQLAYATLNVPSALPEAEPGEFTDLVTPGTSIPGSEPPVRVRLGLDPVPAGPWYYVHPTLDEIEAIADRERRAWMLYKRMMNDPDAPSEREYEMVLPLLGDDTAVSTLLVMLLDFGSSHRKPRRKWRPVPSAPPPPCLFTAFGIDIMLGEPRA